MIKLLYKPLGMLVSLLGGILAETIFKKAWKITAGEDEALRATDAHHGWGEVLLAASLQGAIFAVVKAAVDRGLPQAWKRSRVSGLVRKASRPVTKASRPEGHDHG